MEYINSHLAQQTDSALKIRKSLEFALQQRQADALLLSGGVDSSLLAALNPGIPAITVGLDGESTDIHFAQRVTSFTKTPWYHVEISRQEALEAIRQVMILTNSYDFAIFNTIVDYIGMKYAASLGYRTIRTGDFADELYGGYSNLYTQTDEQHKNQLAQLLPHVKLPSSVVAESLGLKTHFPYLHNMVTDVALGIPVSQNVVSFETPQAGDIFEALYGENKSIKTWGKIALRQAGLGLLPTDVAFRQKTHMEFGSGFSNLREAVGSAVTDEEVWAYHQAGKRFYGKTHAGLYKIFKSCNLSPSELKENEYACGWCGGGVPNGKNHCDTCGGYPSSK